MRQKQTVIGFITGKEMEKGKSISYDLLRIRSDAPAFTREYLFTHFIETYQQQGYQLIDIGMAPLANVGESKYSFLKERFVNIFTSIVIKFMRFKIHASAKNNMSLVGNLVILLILSGPVYSLLLCNFPC